MPKTTRCPNCNDDGQGPRDSCPACEGTGFEPKAAPVSTRFLVEAFDDDEADAQHTMVVTAPTAKRALAKALSLLQVQCAAEGFAYAFSVYALKASADPDLAIAQGRVLERRVTFVGTDNQCRTAGCAADPNDGEGWDGYCGNCADRRAPCRTRA